MESKKSNKEWLEAIKKDHNAILAVPKKFWTHELCLAAVKRDYAAINHMTEENLTKEICLAAFQQSSSAIRYVPKNLREIYNRYLARPNIFNIATKELSQDAFITWLLQWGSKENEIHDEKLHKCGAEFATKLIRKQFKDFNENIVFINADRHWDDIDIWADINNKYLIIIEDKINAKEHSDQLNKYKINAKKWCKKNNYELVCIYLKTGNESKKSLNAVIKKGYSIFSRQDFLELLKKYDIKNEIFIDFKERLITIENINNEWDKKLFKDWNGNDWQGFFQYLENEIDIIDWGFVNNQSGGFWNAVLNWDYYDIFPLYLQTEQDKLCFKISTDPEELDMPKGMTRSQIRNEICEFILNNAEKYGYSEIERPYPFGSGKYMTVAIVNGNNWIGEKEKIIEKENVKKNLEKYLKFLNEIIKKQKTAYNKR
jgi:hypothetical protein